MTYLQQKAKRIEARSKKVSITQDNFVPGFQFFWNLIGPTIVYTYSKAENFGASHGYLSANNQSDIVSIEFKRDGIRVFAMKGGFLLENTVKFHELTPVE